MLSLQELYKKFVELEGTVFKDEWKNEYRTFFIEQYKLYGNGARGFVKKSFTRQKLQKVYTDEWDYFVDTLRIRYEVDGVGLKLLAREIGISYTKVRRLLESVDIPIRKGRNVVTDNLKRVRSENATSSGGWRNRRTKNKNTERGVQGYFFNQSRQKYVWLRSTYEVVLAKWLDKNKIDWDVEAQQWMIGIESYRPDFFIYETDTLVKIIEVKGYFKNRVWKFDELKKEPSLHNVEFSLIDDITPFLDGKTYLGELKWWKQNRLLKLES
jgi:hypothetical protein